MEHTKQYDIELDDLSLDKREAVVVISTDSVDRDGEVLKVAGLRKKNYAGRPVLWGHDSDKFPIGTHLWVKPTGDKRKVIAKMKYHDRTEEARVAFDLLQLGVLRSFSVGFAFDHTTKSPPTSKELPHYPHWQGARAIIRDWELLESSIVNVPANEEALSMAVAKGYTPDRFTFLGERWTLQDCWDWPEEEIEPVQTKKLVAPIYCKSLKWLDTRLSRLRIDEAELMERLKGRG